MLRPISPNPSLWGLIVATCIGFTAVVIFGRAGELVRPYLIARKENVSFSSQIAAWLIERILDLMMVLLIFGVALSQVTRSGIRPGPRVTTILEVGGYTAGAIGIICLAVLLAMRYFTDTMQARLLDGLAFLPERYLTKMRGIVGSFSQGMQSTRRSTFALLLAVYSLAEWLIIAASFACLFQAFPDTARFSLTDTVIFLGFVAFGSAVQVPGIGGGMQITAVLVLTEFFGLTLELSSGIALVLWIVSFVTIVPVGFIFALREGIHLTQLRNLSEKNGQTAAGL